MKIISALFETYAEADTAVSALNALGYRNESISVIAQEEVLKDQEEGSPTATKAGKGAAIGGLVGIVAGAAPIVLPGIGAVIGAGSIIGGALTGAGVGATAGGVVGLLGKLFGESYAEKIQTALKDGHVLVAVRAGENQKQPVADTLERYGGDSVHAHDSEEAPVAVG